MKLSQILVSAAIMALGTTAMAAVPSYNAAQKVNLPHGSHHPVLSPDGTVLLYSTLDHTGLKSLDMVSGEVTTIDETMAAGFRPVFSLDGKKIFYTTASRVNKMMMTDARSYDMTSRKVSELAKPSRQRVKLMSIDRSTYAVDDFEHIDVCVNGKKNEISPIADAHTYEWASLSPDGTKLLFSEPFSGIYVSNLDGSNTRKVAKQGAYPCWVDDDNFVFVDAKNDGYSVIEAKAVLVNIVDGSIADLTGADVIVEEVTASFKTGAIVYSTLEGEFYMLNPKNAR